MPFLSGRLSLRPQGMRSWPEAQRYRWLLGELASLLAIDSV
jgi:hypothetical protein